MHGNVEVARQARKQLGLVTLDEVRREGYSDRAWQRVVASGLWIRAAPRVFRHATVDESFEQRCLAHVLSLGTDAYISHRSAAALLGLDGFRKTPVIDITIASDRRVQQRRQVRVHRSEPLRGSDRDSRHEIAITAPVRTIVDLASCSTTRELANAVDSSFRLGLTTLDRLSARRDTRRSAGIHLLDEVLDGMPNGGLHNRLERDYLALSRTAGLPDPLTQVVFRDGTFTLARVDFLYDLLRLVVEVSGHRTHSSREARAADAKRQRALVARNWRFVEFTSDEVFHEPADTICSLLAVAYPRG